MPSLHLIHSQTRRFQVIPIENRKKTIQPDELAAPESWRTPWEFDSRSCGTGRLLAGLSSEARREFESLAKCFSCAGTKVLIDEDQVPLNILFLLEGNVNLTMNSYGGRRLLLGVGGVGDILGLAYAISGHPSDIMVETRFPCRVAAMDRLDFLGFMARNPTASANLTQELSLDYSRACERVRTLGLASRTKAKLAFLLLEWCGENEETDHGTQFSCRLTHEEIGDCIGTSRETVTRALTDLRNRNLVKQRGSIFIVPNRSALAAYGVNDRTFDPNDPVVA